MTTKTFVYRPRGVCSQAMEITIENDIVTDVNIFGGCSGNALGIKALVEGLSIDEVILKLKGISCGSKGTSCPDQLAKALEEAKDTKPEEE